VTELVRREAPPDTGLGGTPAHEHGSAAAIEIELSAAPVAASP
jgi:hypothetical protein